MIRLLILFLIIPSLCYGQEVIESFDDQNISVLNEELRVINGKVRQLNSGLSILSTTGILTTDRGGTGKDFSAATADSLAFFDTTGVMALTPTSAGSTTKFLRGDYTFQTPSGLSNVIFYFPSNIDENPTTYGKAVAATLTGAMTYEYSGNYQIYAVDSGVLTYSTVVRTKFKKMAGVSTLSGTLMLWCGTTGGSQTGNAKIRVNGALDSNEVTASTATPASKSWSVDISSLTDGTEYDIEVMLKDNFTTNNTDVRVAEIVGYGS